MRLGVRPRLWTERGGWGDLGCVLTSGRDGRGWLNRQAAAVLAGSSVFTMRRHFGGPAVSGWGSLDALRIAHLLAMMALPGGWRLRSAGSSYRAGHGDCNRTERGRDIEIWWGRPQNVQGTAKRKGNDETNTMMCSPSAKDERRWRKSSPELRRSHRSWGRWRSRRRNRVTDPIMA
jgi:hypothetical protein